MICFKYKKAMLVTSYDQYDIRAGHIRADCLLFIKDKFEGKKAMFVTSYECATIKPENNTDEVEEESLVCFGTSK